MSGSSCPNCNQVNEPGELCGKCMWMFKTTPMRFQLQASVAGSLSLEKGPGCYVCENIEIVPDWVHIRYVPSEKWDGTPTPPIHLRSPKHSLSVTDRPKFATAFFAPPLTQEFKDAGDKTLPEIIKDLLASNAETDVNLVAVILRDNEANKAFLTKFCSNLVASGDTYWVSVPLPDGSAKTMRLGAWFTQYQFIDESTKLIMLGNFSAGNPIIEFRFSGITIQVDAPDSTNSEYSARDVLREILDLSEADFEYEPNGTATFPDWSMSWMGQTWNVEVTRVKEEVKKIVQMDNPNWPDQVDDVRRSRPRPADLAKIMQRKANRAASSDIPTILVVFNETGNSSYEDIDLSAFFAVVEIDETTRDHRLIKPRRASPTAQPTPVAGTN